MIKRFLTQVTNLNITIEAVPDPSVLPRPESSPSSTWSTVEEVDSPSSYQDVLAGRLESRQVDQGMPPLEEEVDPSYEHQEHLYEPEPRPEPRRTNIFTDNAARNVPSGRGEGYLVSW